MASTSSSHQQKQEFKAFSGKRRAVSESSRLFDVFINHRGPDVKQTLAIQLYNSLEQLGIRAFLDSEEKELGDSFPSTIETAISSASVHIAIFSKRYAESVWCLSELSLMLQSEAKIIPVFYGVKPCDLRHIEKGVYAEAFIKHYEKGRYLDMLNEWKEALQSLSLIAGEEFNSFNEWNCQNIVAAVQKEVQRKTLLPVTQFPVGLNSLVKDFEKRSLESLVQDFEKENGLKDKAKAVGIFGMGGSGKTTLAKELFNQRRSNYSRACFLFDVREAFERRELPSLQLKLLKDLFHSHHLSFKNTEEGTSYLKDNLRRSPAKLSFLIVVDDINHVEQLNALLVMDIVNKLSNSLVIVTTRDVGVLISAGIVDGYHLKGMDRKCGSELFCWHAFDQPNPSRGYEDLVNSFVDVCGGLPLSLQVLGRHVHGRSEEYWRSKLIEVRKTLPRDVKQRLRISFDSLNAEEKQVFMDIACFFGGRHQSIAESVWEASGWNAQLALETLKDKCLVEEINTYLNDLRMHDHLRDLGREMALELSPPHRLWRCQDLKHLELKGFKNILTKTNIRCFHSVFEESMNSRVTFFIGQPDNCVEMSASLLWLELKGNSTKQPMTSIPSWIPLQSLQCLKINRARLEMLWENRIQAPSQLTELHISQTSLKKIPRYVGISDNLEKVFIDAQGLSINGLSLLESLSMNLCRLCLRYSTVKGEQVSTKRGVRITCESLVICNFKLSGEVAWNNGGMSSSIKAPMSNLERLEISDEELVSKILISGFHYSSLQSIKIHYMENLKEVDLIEVNTLNYLNITNCKKLKILKSGSGVFYLPKLVELNITQYRELHLKSVSGIPHHGNLVELNVNDCKELVTGGLSISKCPELEELMLAHLSLLKIITIEHCNHLKRVGFSGMRCLESIRFDGNVKVKSFKLDGCQTSKIIKFCCEKLVELNIQGCPELEELPDFRCLRCVEKIMIDGCVKLKYLQVYCCPKLRSVSGNLEVTKLYIENCPELEELPSPSGLNCLEKIDINNCNKLHNITLPKTLMSLYMRKCRKLQRAAGTGDLIKLTELEISDCPELEELPSLSTMNCLEKIEINFCKKLQNIKLPTAFISLSIESCGVLQRVVGTGDLSKVTRLCISDSPELEELPSLSCLNCLEKIEIDYCEKLQNIILPTTVISLSIQCCRDLQRVAGTGVLTKLTELYLKKCPELEDFPSLSGLSRLEQIAIDSCEKVEKIEGIQELPALRSMQLFYCSNAVIQHCVPRLQTVQSDYTFVIGRAVDGVESTLNEYLFYDGDIGADAVTNIVTEIGTGNGDKLENCRVLGTVIVCIAVVVESSTSVEDINKLLPHGFSFYDSRLEVRHGEWVITMVAPRGYLSCYYHYYMKIEDVLRRFGIMKRRFLVEVKKDEEWKGVQVLHRIVDRLYH